MAKKKGIDTGSTGDSVFDLINSIDDSAEIIAESKTAVISDYIGTGSYILNAAMTGSLFKGVPTGRVTTLAGPSGCGKSYLALSICRSAQKKGYTPVYMDSESAIDKEFVERLGCDTSNFIIKQVSTISEVSTFIANLCIKLKETPENSRPKIILVLDSLGNLTSTKELTDTIEANNKRDMTKQQEIKAMFRTNATPLGQLGIPFIVNSHIYQTQDLFSKQVVSGGCLTDEYKVITERGEIKISEINVGDNVLTHDGTYKPVIKTFSFDKPTIRFTFENDVSIECSRTHRFLVDETNMVWKTAEELEEGDFIYSYNQGYTELKILKKVEYTSPKPVYDICVEDNHSYVTSNKIINHNSGIQYNSSVTIMMNTAKLDDKESDKVAGDKVGEFTKTGVLVTATPAKSRFTIPQKVKFQIPFFKSPNPYVGLEAYITWENSGILRGKMLNEKEYSKLSAAEQEKCFEMTNEKGETAYAYPKDTSKKIVVKHLHSEVPLPELFTSKVLTDEILHKLDDDVIRPNFELPSQGNNDDIDEFVETEMIGDEQ